DGKLKPLESLRMSSADILKEYSNMPPGMMQMTRITDLLPQDQFRRLMSGTAEERYAVVNALDETKRRQVLGMVAPQQLIGTPDLQKEAEAARQAANDERQKEFRKRMPPLPDLLNQDQMATAMRGNPEQLRALFDYLDPVKRQQVAAALPPQALAELPEYRRMGMRLRQPQMTLTGDVREGKLFRALY